MKSCIFILLMFCYFTYSYAQDNTIKVRKNLTDSIVADTNVVAYFGTKTGGTIGIEEVKNIQALFATGNINGKPVEVVQFKVTYSVKKIVKLSYHRKGSNKFSPEMFQNIKAGNRLVVSNIHVKDADGKIHKLDQVIKLNLIK